MTALCILGVAVTNRHVGVAVLSLERLERHELFARDGRKSPVERIAAIVSTHAPRFVALTWSSRRLGRSRLVEELRSALRAESTTFYEHAALRANARKAGLPLVNRERASAYARRYPSLAPRIPKRPPLRSVRTPFERHHEPVFRALVAADLLLRDRLNLELPLYEPPTPHPA